MAVKRFTATLNCELWVLASHRLQPEKKNCTERKAGFGRPVSRSTGFPVDRLKTGRPRVFRKWSAGRLPVDRADRSTGRSTGRPPVDLSTLKTCRPWAAQNGRPVFPAGLLSAGFYRSTRPAYTGRPEKTAFRSVQIWSHSPQNLPQTSKLSPSCERGWSFCGERVCWANFRSTCC